MSPSKSKTAPVDHAQAVPVSFEEAVAELEALVNTMDSQNLGLDQRKDLRVGDTVLVKRAGEVIPQVVSPITEHRTGKEQAFTPPNPKELDKAALIATGLAW